MKPRNRKPFAKGRAPRATVDGYLARVPEPARSALERVRAIVRKAAPEQATETISYRIPAFRYKGILLWFAAFSGHCSLFARAAVLRELKGELKGYDVSKGTIRFPPDRPLPSALIRKLVKASVRRNELRAS